MPGLEPRMSETVCCVAWVVVIWSSSCLEACVHSWWYLQDGVGTVLAVVVLRLRVLGLCMWVQARSSSCLAAEVQSWWCRQNGWWHCAVCWFVIACSWALYEGSSSVVKLLGGRGAIVVVSSRRLMALCILLLWCGCVFFGSVCRVRARSSSCLAAEVQSWWCCQVG